MTASTSKKNVSEADSTQKETIKSADATKKLDENELNEEDKQLQEELDLCMTRLTDSDIEIRYRALEILRDRIRTATSSLTSVPKPLKLLRPKWQKLVEAFDLHNNEENNDHSSWFLHAEILSCVGMTIDDDNSNYCLKYRLLAETFTGIRPEVMTASIINVDLSDEIIATANKSKARENASRGLGSWGHEYVKRLAYDLILSWNELENDETTSELDKNTKKLNLNNLVVVIVPFFMAFNAETDACDLLMEVDQVHSIINYINVDNVSRVCLYLTSCEPYVSEKANTNLLKTVLEIRKKLSQWPEAMYIALRLNNLSEVQDIFFNCKDFSMQKQLAFILGRQHIFLQVNEMDAADEAGISSDDQEELVEIMSNTHLSANFLTLATELDIREAKTPDDVYKTHLENTRPGMGPSGSMVESAKMSLAAAYVNAFVNCGFGKDKLMQGDEGNKFIHRNKDHGKIAATASIGAIQLWDVDSGLTAIDKYLYAKEDEIKAGAFLGCGVVSAGISNECDPAYALLSDYLKNKSVTLRKGAIYGLGMAYAGSNREDVLNSILEFMNYENTESTEMDDNDNKQKEIAKNINEQNPEILALSALTCGLIAVSTCSSHVTGAILAIIKEKSIKEELSKDTWYRMLAVGLALPFLCQQEAVKPTILALEALISDDSADVDFRDFTIVLLEGLAYAATGNVLKVQHFLHICSESVEKSKKEEETEKKKTEPEKSTSKINVSDIQSLLSNAQSSALAGAIPAKKPSTTETPSTKTSSTSIKKSTSTHYSKHQAAVLGIALVAMNEDIGSDMTMRVLGSLLRYGETIIKKTVPLAFALLSISNPRLSVLDALSKLSHDSDIEVAQNATFAMGLVASGTNNARLAQQLRQLAQYHSKDGSTLFLVRLTQGLVHMGKGTMTLQPYQGDRALLNNVSMAGLITTLVAFFDAKGLILGDKNAHYLLYSLFLAVQPKMLLTFDEKLKPLHVSVRVGQAVDVVGQAGRPKTITGFQTRTTPVLLGYGERAELATDEYLSLTPVLEGHVILKKNPDYDESSH